MMLSAETIRQLRQTNISADAELTKERVRSLWKSATPVQREIILAFAGLKQTAVSRAYTTGNISIKIVLAMAQALNINPFYLTSEAVEKGAYTMSALNAFLTDKQYADLAQQEEAATREQKQVEAPNPVETPQAVKVAGTAVAVAAQQPDEPVAPADTEPTEDESMAITALAEEDAMFLLQTLYIRAKYSHDAQDKLDKVKDLLVG
jgi:hypothetical protein